MKNIRIIMPSPFRIIVADPPWLERGAGKVKRGADRHYPLLKTKEIPGVMTASKLWRPAPDCLLFLWVTNNFLEDGLWVMKELGFRYITNRVWLKTKIGLGQYFRGQHELQLMGRSKATQMPGVKTLSTVIGGRPIPATEHSRKPEESYAELEEAYPGPYLEMFARIPRPGWSAWGNEIEETRTC